MKKNQFSKKPKGLLLFSGGLDSILAAKILMELDLDLTGIYCTLPFMDPNLPDNEFPVYKAAKRIGLNLRIIHPHERYLKMFENPPHGFGKRINPCIDCKILFLTIASEILKEENFDFIATGEVNGQRPMSQRKDMIIHIEKQSNLVGKVLRPLSIDFFPLPDIIKEGIIDKSKLLNINGRGRKEQMQLVKKYGITEYESPAGGCLFTDPNYSRRLKYLKDKNIDVSAVDLFLLSKGRHFLLESGLHFILGRNKTECSLLANYYPNSTYYSDPDFSAPNILIFGNSPSIQDLETAASVLLSYSREKQPVDITFESNTYEAITIRNIQKMDREFIEKIRL